MKAILYIYIQKIDPAYLVMSEYLKKGKIYYWTFFWIQHVWSWCLDIKLPISNLSLIQNIYHLYILDYSPKTSLLLYYAKK